MEVLLCDLNGGAVHQGCATGLDRGRSCVGGAGPPGASGRLRRLAGTATRFWLCSEDCGWMDSRPLEGTSYNAEWTCPRMELVVGLSEGSRDGSQARLDVGSGRWAR